MSTGFGPDGTGELPVVDEPARPGRGLMPQARRRWYSAIGATAALALLAGGVMTLAPHHRHPVTQLAADCGLIHCDATLPGAIATTSPSAHLSTARPHHKTRKPASPARPVSKSREPTPAASATSTKPTPSPPPPPPSPTPKPPAGPNVAVAYSLDRVSQWGNHFHAHLTIINRGSQAVSGWNIQLALPGDRVEWVGYQQGGWGGTPFDAWGFSGSTLTLSANGGEALSPGASQTVYIDGWGSTTSPGGCTFDGASCHS